MKIRIWWWWFWWEIQFLKITQASGEGCFNCIVQIEQLVQ